jgi:phage N-6-adenine-methyltransferase
MDSKNSPLFSHNKDDWRTPKDLFDKLNEKWKFTLDAAADDTNHLCDNYFTEKDNALEQDWTGRVYCNPPYSMNKQFVQKAFTEYVRQHTEVIVMLLPSRTDVRWFHDYVYHIAEIEFIKGRLKFSESKNSAPFPSMIVVWK